MTEETQKAIAERVKIERQKIGTGIKTLAPDKLLARLSILLAQIKAGNKSYKL